MENLEVLKVFLKEHSDHSSQSLEEDETDCDAIRQLVETFLISGNEKDERILCGCLDDSRTSVQGLALYGLLKTRKLGRELHAKTLERLEKIEKSKDCHDLGVLRTVEKRFKAESRE